MGVDCHWAWDGEISCMVGGVPNYPSFGDGCTGGNPPGTHTTTYCCAGVSTSSSSSTSANSSYSSNSSKSSINVKPCKTVCLFLDNFELQSYLDMGWTINNGPYSNENDCNANCDCNDKVIVPCCTNPISKILPFTITFPGEFPFDCAGQEDRSGDLVWDSNSETWKWNYLETEFLELTCSDGVFGCSISMTGLCDGGGTATMIDCNTLEINTTFPCDGGGFCTFEMTIAIDGCCSSSSSSSSSSGGFVTLPCCADTPIPTTLHMSVVATGPCDGDYTGVWNGTGWVFDMCPDVILTCDSSPGTTGWKMTNGAGQTWYSSNGQCTPFFAQEWDSFDWCECGGNGSGSLVTVYV